MTLNDLEWPFYVCDDDHFAHLRTSSIVFIVSRTLLSSYCQGETRAVELDHLEQWAAANNLKLNRRKSTEIVGLFVDSRRRRSVVPPSPLTSVSRVSSMKMLGVIVSKT